MDDNELEHLTPTELLYFQKHIKLGRQHLEAFLTQDEIDEIIRLGEVGSHISEMTPDAAEMSGHVTLIFNTILTATLGAWMGLSGFMGFSLNSKNLFIAILIFSLFVGMLIGFQNFRLTKDLVEKKIEDRKLQKVEILCIQLMIRNRVAELKSFHQRIGDILKSLHIDHRVLESLPDQFNDNELCLAWLNQCRAEEGMDQIVDGEVEELKKSLEDKIVVDVQRTKNKESMPDAVHKLISFPLDQPATHKFSIRDNLKQLLILLVPTVFGGFSSLFVYLGGAPQIAHELGEENIFHYLTRPHVKTAQLILAICTTIYFGCVYIYMGYKTLKRDRELRIAQRSIIDLESSLARLDDKLLKFKSIYARMLRVSRVYKVMEKMKHRNDPPHQS